VVHTLAGTLTGCWVANDSFNKGETSPLRGRLQESKFFCVALIAGAEFVQPNNALIQFEQGFGQVAAYNASDPGGRPISSLDFEFIHE
jgi:hypothetical protein